MENKNQKENTTIIKFDLWSIVRIILIALGLWFLYLIRDVIFIVIVAGLLATVITPAVNFFEKRKLPRWAGVLIVYLCIVLVLFLIGWAVLPVVVEQGRLLIAQLPDFLRSVMGRVSAGSRAEFANLLNNWLSKSALSGKTVFSLLGTVAGQIISFFMVMVIAFYLSVKKRIVRSFVNSIVPAKYQDFLEHFVESVQREIGAWARGVILLILFVGIMAYIGLSILGVKYALTLAIIASLTELIPYIGATLGAIPAVIVAFTQSPTLGLLVIILYLIIQQIEGVLLSPYVMHRVVGLDPLVIILVLLIGGKIAGPAGMILAVPAATILSILVKYYLKHRKKVAGD